MHSGNVLLVDYTARGQMEGEAIKINPCTEKANCTQDMLDDNFHYISWGDFVNCSIYYSCSTDGFVIAKSCPTGTVFDPPRALCTKMGSCQQPCLITTQSSTLASTAIPATIQSNPSANLPSYTSEFVPAATPATTNLSIPETTAKSPTSQSSTSVSASIHPAVKNFTLAWLSIVVSTHYFFQFSKFCMF